MPKEFSLEGLDFPKNLPEFEERFSSDAACREYLRDQRWPEGFRCARCRNNRGWLNARGWMECRACGHQTSLTSGTVLHNSRSPLQLWFRAMWLVCTQKTGMSAAGLKRTLGLKSMQTAWTWLQKLRKAMVRLEREPLTGRVQVDDALLGQARERVGPSWQGAHLALAVEMDPETGEIGRIRVKNVTASPRAGFLYFIRREVDSAALIETDDRDMLDVLEHAGWRRTVVAQHVSGQCLPRVRRILPLILRWLLGTHQGRVERRHLQGYLDEFVFRFNRRKSPHVGLLFQRLVSQSMQIQATPYATLALQE